MVFKYKELNRTKYKYINPSLWPQRVSQSQSAQAIAYPSEIVIKKQKNILKRKKQELNVENQLYLQKRLKTESFA